jgi:hypothetical protein
MASGEASKVFQLVETALNAVALAVERFVVPKASVRLSFDWMTAFMPAAFLSADGIAERSGRPSASASRWILVVNPPRERPRASS